MSATGHEPLLAVRGLRVEFRTAVGLTRAVNGVDFTLERGETLAILGESGSGKSVSAQAIMRIIDSPPGKITGGSVRLQGEDLLQLDAGGDAGRARQPHRDGLSGRAGGAGPRPSPSASRLPRRCAAGAGWRARKRWRAPST